MTDTKTTAETIEDKLGEGWAFPGAARQCHYFVGMESLCRRWGFFTGPREPDTGKPRRDDCAPCRRELDRREKQPAPPEHH